MMKDRKRLLLDDEGSDEDEEESKEVWCVCRTSEINRFMIGCDKCEEWFHGDCVGVTEKRAKMIKNYYCDACTRRNPRLSIVYKTGEVVMRKKRRGSVNTSEHGPPTKKKHRSEKSSSGRIPEARDSSDFSDLDRVSYMPDDDFDDDFDDIDVREEEEELRLAAKRHGGFDRSGRSSSRFANWENIVRKTSTNIRKQRSKNESQSTSDDHLDSRLLSHRPVVESVGLLDDDDLSRPSFADQPSSVFSAHTGMDDDDDFEPPYVGAVPRRPAATLVTSSALPRTPASPPPAGPGVSSSPGVSKSGGKKKSSGGKKAGGSGKRKKTAGGGGGKRRRLAGHSGSQARNARLAATQSDSDSDSDSSAGEQEAELSGALQCYGPACVREARRGSKYCSDECGLRLAYNRIFEILPLRIQQWNNAPCAANEKNKRQLERIRADLHRCRERCVQMEREAQALTRLQERIRAVKVDKAYEPGESDEEQVEQIICVTCGNEVSLRAALRHMEKCFAKIESQSSFGTVYKSKDGANLFCDAYNKQAKTYCKRLKVICPEHSKDMKFPSDAICGFPLMRDVYHETDTFCRTPKRRCTKHFLHWERIRKARIDVEVVRQLMKMEDLMNEEREIRAAMTNRSGVLGLMLHQSISHDPDPNPSVASYQAGGQACS